MPNIDDYYSDGGGTFLKAADLNKKRVNVTIAGASLADLQDGQKVVLEFEGTDKTLPLNKTNARMIKDILGTGDTDKWIKTTISLRPDKTQLQDGRPVDCIRVDYELPAQKHADSLGAQVLAGQPGAAQPAAAAAASGTVAADDIPF